MVGNAHPTTTIIYQNWYERGMDKAQAMLTVMKTYQQPSHWAAFTIMGEAR
jgi:CHAT domain-containing protein